MQESPKEHQRPENFMHVRDRLMRQGPELLRPDLIRMSKGEDLGGDRAKFYPGWSDADFADLLDLINNPPRYRAAQDTRNRISEIRQ